MDYDCSSIVSYIVSQKSRSEQKQEIYVGILQKLLRISMWQWSEELYNFVDIWEPEDMKNAMLSSADAEEER